MAAFVTGCGTVVPFFDFSAVPERLSRVPTTVMVTSTKRLDKLSFALSPAGQATRGRSRSQNAPSLPRSSERVRDRPTKEHDSRWV